MAELARWLSKLWVVLVVVPGCLIVVLGVPALVMTMEDLSQRQRLLDVLLVTWLVSMLAYVLWEFWLGRDLRDPATRPASEFAQRQHLVALSDLPLRDLVAPMMRILVNYDAKCKLVHAHTLGSNGIIVIIDADLAAGHALSRAFREDQQRADRPYVWVVSGEYSESRSLERMAWHVQPMDVRLNIERAAFNLDTTKLRDQLLRIAQALEQRLAHDRLEA